MKLKRYWFGLFAASLAITALGVHAEPSQAVTEDDPSWNCATMGNRLCGPVYIQHLRVRVTQLAATSYAPCHKRHKNRCGTSTLQLKWGGELSGPTHILDCINPHAVVIGKVKATHRARVWACHEVHLWRVS